MSDNILSLINQSRDSLALLSSVRVALARLQCIDEVKDIRDKAEALRAYYKRRNESLGAHNDAFLVKLESERRIGRLLADMEKSKGFVSKSTKRGDCESPRLSDIGISKKQSSRFQAVASVSDAKIDRHVKAAISAAAELTTAGILAIAKSAKKQSVTDDSEYKSAVAAGSLQSLVDSGQKFRTIYADPPWQYDNQATRASTDNHYATMRVDEISDLPVAGLVEDKALLFLWTTNGFLFESQRIIDAWGFEFKSSMVWVKPQMGIGNYVRNAHEFLLIASRGGARTEDAGRSQISWIESDRTKHSRKPVEFRDAVERMSLSPRLEMFGRNEANGWTVWGNEVDAQQTLKVVA